MSRTFLAVTLSARRNARYYTPLLRGECREHLEIQLLCSASMRGHGAFRALAHPTDESRQISRPSTVSVRAVTRSGIFCRCGWNRKRLAEHVERALLVAEFLQDHAEPGNDADAAGGD
jgi:hypothetical protein